MKIQGRFSRFIVPDLKCLKNRRRRDKRKLRWSEHRSFSCGARRERSSRKTCEGITFTGRGKLRALSSCRIVLDFFRLFRYATCHFSLCIFHRADQRRESQDEIFKEEKGRFHFTDLCNKEISFQVLSSVIKNYQINSLKTSDVILIIKRITACSLRFFLSGDCKIFSVRAMHITHQTFLVFTQISISMEFTLAAHDN